MVGNKVRFLASRAAWDIEFQPTADALDGKEGTVDWIDSEDIFGVPTAVTVTFDNGRYISGMPARCFETVRHAAPHSSR